MPQPLLPLAALENAAATEPSVLKEWAEYYRIGLELGLISIAEAIDVDR